MAKPITIIPTQLYLSQTPYFRNYFRKNAKRHKYN